MKKINLLSVLFFYSFFMFSQQKNNIQMREALSAMKLTSATSFTTGLWIPGNSLDSNVEGSPYLFTDSYSKYILKTKNGGVIEISNLNYNIQTKKLESSISKDSVFQFNLNDFDYVINFNKKYKVVIDNQHNGLFFEIFDGGKIKLYKETNIYILKGIVSPLTAKKINEDTYEKRDSYYFVVDDKFEKIKLNKSNILDKLSDKRKMIEEFVSTNKLSYKSDGDINKILIYYSSI